MKAKFAHLNFNVIDLEKSMKFYEEALGLSEVRRVEKPDFTLVYLGDGETDFQLELTCLHGRTQKYDLGEGEFHIAFTVRDFDAAYSIHKEMGCICYENNEMGIYFIEDPDGYWAEIIPEKK